MIALEIQALSEKREGLLIEIGRCVVASGFVLQRHRLVQDKHGTLLTMVVRGPAPKQRALAAALESHERIISFQLSAFDEAMQKPHFAASHPMAWPSVAPLPSPGADDAVIADAAAAVAVADPATAPVAVEAATEVDDLADLLRELESPAKPASDVVSIPTPPAAPVVTAVIPFVELIPLGPEVMAVEQVLPKIIRDYPQIFPHLLKLDHAVAAAAREASLLLAGQRMGVWACEGNDASVEILDLREAVRRIAIPALGALVDLEHHGDQLHIRHSPLCVEDGRSGCVFFSGYLEGLLTRATASSALSIFSVCCRSWGADACVLAMSE